MAGRGLRKQNSVIVSAFFGKGGSQEVRGKSQEVRRQGLSLS